jgi:hypothetical protein
VGTVLEAAMGPCQGKQTSELALLRTVIAQFQPGDIVLADRFFCSYWVIAALQARGVDVVVRLHQRRTADFRRGRRLGREDHIVTWTKPQQVPDWMSRAAYDAMPAQLTIRELRVRVQDKTKRVRNLVIVTTLLDAKTYQAKELGGLFRQRWYAELDLRSLKTDMRMELLSTKSPEMVGKEVAVHLLAGLLLFGIVRRTLLLPGFRERILSTHTLNAKQLEEAQRDLSPAAHVARGKNIPAFLILQVALACRRRPEEVAAVGAGERLVGRDEGHILGPRFLGRHVDVV